MYCCACLMLKSHSEDTNSNECHFADYPSAECHFVADYASENPAAECLYAERNYADGHSDVCHSD